MSETNQSNDILMPPTDKPVLPSGLNVLTILTIIGCVLGLIFGAYSFATAKSSLDKMEAAINSPDYEKMPEFAKKMMSPEMLDIARKSYENRVPINLINFVALGLCLFGALQMRKLKAQGYPLYVVGELLPILATAFFIGVKPLTGMMGIITIGLALLFVLLYTAQRKYLTVK